MYETEQPPTEMVGRLARLVIALLVVAAFVGPGLAQETPTPLVVDRDGEGYDSIRAALAAAEDGDTIRVRPGTYEESVVVNKSVTLLAPEGATLRGTTMDSETAIRITGDAEPTIRGVTIEDYRVGVDAAGTSGDWTIEAVRISDTDVVGVRAADTSGDWSVIDTVITDAGGIGIGAFRSSGNWSLVSVTVRNTAGVGVNARNADGDWFVTDTEIGPTTNGSTLQAPVDGTGLLATNTTGQWTVQNSAIHNATGASVDATGADPAGRAVTNWWGTNGSDCVGNVSCTQPLGDRPPAVGAPNASVAPSGESSTGGGGLPVGLLVGVGLVVVAVGGTVVAVRTMGRNAVIDRIESVIAAVASLAELLPVGDADAQDRRIVLANVDSQTVTCRVRCRTGDGVQFEYDLHLDPDERREARELPGDRPFELTVQVEGGGRQETFESPTDVVVRIAAHDAEISAA